MLSSNQSARGSTCQLKIQTEGIIKATEMLLARIPQLIFNHNCNYYNGCSQSKMHQKMSDG